LIKNLLDKTIGEIEATVATENAAQEAFNTEEARVKEILVNL
jgi:SUMO ligase MMS21 Smc5/6 complex component